MKDWDPQDSRSGCQNGYMAAPAGWEIAANNADSIAVAAAHPWWAPVPARTVRFLVLLAPWWVQGLC